MKKYRKLPCGCKYGIDDYEDNKFCKNHKKYLEIQGMIADDLRELVKKAWLTPNK